MQDDTGVNIMKAQVWKDQEEFGGRLCFKDLIWKQV